MKKEANEDIEKDIDITHASETDTATETESDDKNDSTDTSTEESDSQEESESNEDSDANDHTEKEDASEDTDEEKASGKNTVLIVELLIAAVAIGFIIFALVSNNRGNNSVSNNNASSNNTVTGEDNSNIGTVTIDNSILYEDVPALPDLAELNTMTESEAEAAVADGTMLKLEMTDGGYVYVNNYTDLDYLSEQVVPSDEEVDDTIFYNITYYYIEVTQGADHTTVENGDVINANYVGKLDGVAFAGGTAENVEIQVGTGGYIPGFEEGFIGMEVGETKDVPVTFPENYGNTDLAGKDVIFTLTVNDITGTYTVPDLTDEIVKEIFYDGSATTVEECREYFRTMILQDNIWDFIMEKYYVTSLSEESVYSYYNMMMESYDQTSIGYQIPIADLLAYSGETIEDLKEEAILNSSHTTIEDSIYRTIADKHGITVTQEDIDSLALDYGYANTDIFIADFGEDIINAYLYQSKVLDYIVSLL